MRVVMRLFLFFGIMMVGTANIASELIEIKPGITQLTFTTGFASRNSSELSSCDIDAYALFFNNEGYLLDSVSAYQPLSGDKSTSHSGDANKVGNEFINFDLSRVRKDVAMIGFAVADHSQVGFNKLSNLELSLMDRTTGNFIFRTPQGFHYQNKNYTALSLGILMRISPTTWVFHHAPEFGSGHDRYSITDEVYRSMLKFRNCEEIQAGMRFALSQPGSTIMVKNRRVYIPASINFLYYTGGWDINSKRATEHADLDINIHIVPNMPTIALDKESIETVFYDNMKYPCTPMAQEIIIQLDKDNRNGSDDSNSTWGFNKNIFSDKDDEKIEINLQALKQKIDIARLFATITVYNDGAKNENIGFACIKNPFIRLLDGLGNQIAFFDLRDLCKLKKRHRKKKNTKGGDPIFAYLAFEIARDKNGLWYYQLLDKKFKSHEGVSAPEINDKLISFQKKREQRRN